MRAVTERPHFGSREFSTIAYPLFGRRWACGGDVASGGRALQWFARLCHGRDGVDAALLRAIEREISAVPPGAGGLLFIPHLGGEVSPHRRLDARGALIGLRAEMDRGHIARAVMEGVALALRSILTRLEARGIVTRQFRATGGGARSAAWVQVLADVLGRPVGVAEEEASARGAALLLFVAQGVYRTIEEASRAMAREAGRAEPRRAHHAAYDEAFAKYEEASEMLYRLDHGRRSG
ncbi:MAG: hypothetical protein HY660_10270 [Armatimonadetes bacterium]|nr:hypothetical protein [Armatimonadota bacterium]